MNSIFYKLKILLVISSLSLLGAAPPTPIPVEFKVHTELSNQSPVDIKIVSQGNLKRYLVSYRKGFGLKNHELEKPFSNEVTENLFNNLFGKTPPFSEWPLEVVCPEKQIWRIELDHKKKQVCKDPKITHALLEFQKSVALILKSP